MSRDRIARSDRRRNWRRSCGRTKVSARRDRAALSGARRSARKARRLSGDRRRSRRWRRPARPTRRIAPAKARPCSACRSRTRTSSSPATFRAPPARRCWQDYRSPFDATVVRRLGRRPGAGDPGQAELRRIRDGLVQRELGVPAGAATRGTARAFRAARRAAAPWRWPRGWRRPRPAPTPAARSASRLRFAASPASSRPTAALRATA